MKLLTAAIAAAITSISSVIKLNAIPRSLVVQAAFVYGAGGTSVDAYLQTSIDGVNWIDIANFHFLTTTASAIYNLSSLTAKTTAVVPTDGALAGNTVVDGILGSQFRVKMVTVGTYTGTTTLTVDLATDQQA